MRISATARVGICLLAVSFLLSVSPAAAQQSSGMLSGVVVDGQGAVVPGANVTLINQAQGGTFRKLETSSEGTFVITPMPPGTYTVTVEKAGFKKYVQTDITLFAQDRTGLPPIRLEVGAGGESITVEASSVTLQTVSAERSGVITGSQIVDLASSGRAFTDLLKTIPGFNPDTNNANGLRVDQNALMVDGISTMDAGNNGTGLMRLNSDLIAEFKVLTNGQPAEYGRAAGANITIVTNSGSKDLHGGAYLFLRNEWMNANSWTNNQSGQDRARARDRTQGFQVGGPAHFPGKFNSGKEKLFFFTNFEFQRPRLFDALVNKTMPTTEERAGDFSKTQENNEPVVIKDPTTGVAFPLNQIPQTRINKYGLELLNVLPKPNRINVDPAYNYQYQFAGSDSRDDAIFRGDWNISTNWKAYARLILNKRDILQQQGLNVNNVIGISPFLARQGAIAGSGNLTTIISPTLTNEFNYGNTRNWLPNVIPSDSKYLRSNSGVTLPLLYPNADSLGQIPNLTWDVPNSPTIYIAGMPYDNENPSVNWTDNVAKVTNKHTMKFGVFIDSSFKRQTATIVNNGRIDFSRDSSNPGDTGWAYANALLGNYTTFEQSNDYRKGYYKYQTYEWYAQDNWKVKSNLSVDFGVRFSLMKPWYDDKDQISSFRTSAYDAKNKVTLYQPTLVNGVKYALNPLNGQTFPQSLIGAIVPDSGDPFNGIVVAGQNGVERGLLKSAGVLLGPRFGVAWIPAGVTARTVVRMGGGVFYERIQGNMIFNQINYPPGLLTPKMYYGNLNGVASSAGTPYPLNVAGLSPEGKIPTVYNYNLSVQRELPGKLLVDVGYVGTQTRHGLARAPFNEAPFGSAWLPQNQDPTKAAGNLTGDNAMPVDFLRPYTGYAGGGTAVAQSGIGGGGFIATYGSSSNYNALQISANRRMPRDLTIGINYTWGKTLGTDTDFQYAGNPVDHRKADYGLLLYDRTQSLVVNYIYSVPRLARNDTGLAYPLFNLVLNGWQISGITSLTSGSPLTVGGGASVSAVGSYGVQGVGATTLNRQITGSEGWAPRPVLTCNPNLSPGDRTLGAFIDTSCFQPAVKGSTGMDSAVRPMRGPGVNNWDLSLFKKIPLGNGEQRYLQGRLEMYNAWNHTQWNGINFTPTFDKTTGAITNLPSVPGSTGGGRFGFGALNSVRGARTIQIAAKFNF